jgi:hypothetical protein
MLRQVDLPHGPEPGRAGQVNPGIRTGAQAATVVRRLRGNDAPFFHRHRHSSMRDLLSDNGVIRYVLDT